MKQKKRTFIILGIFILLIGLIFWRTISINTYHRGFNIQIENQSTTTIPYIAFGALDPVHTFTDIAPGSNINTHVDSMGGERVILFIEHADGSEEKIPLMYVMSRRDVHIIKILATDSKTSGETVLQIKSLDGSLVLPWWIRRLYAYHVTEIPL